MANAPLHIDDAQTAFPASEATPGQARSRQAREAFLEKREECVWWREYLELRLEGWDWRKAAYIAWASSPARDRWPDNMDLLATDVLGLKGARVIRHWREKDPTIDDRVADLQVAPLMQHRRDIFDNLIGRATGDDKYAFQYIKIALTITRDLEKKDAKGHAPAEAAGSSLTDAELEQQIRNLQAAYKVAYADDESDGDA